MEDEKIEFRVLEELREYIVFNDITINCKDDLLRTFIEIIEDCYLHEVSEAGKMNVARDVMNRFVKYYAKDKSILENDLIMFGPTPVMEKIKKEKKRISVK